MAGGYVFAFGLVFDKCDNLVRNILSWVPSDDREDLRGIVHPTQGLRHFKLDRWAPDQELSRVLDRFWSTSWELDEPFTQSVLGFPVVNLVVQSDGSATVTGVLTQKDERRLEGAGWAFGVMFRPAGFRPLVNFPMKQLTDRRIPAPDIFGRESAQLAEEVAAASTGHEKCLVLGEFIRSRLPTETTTSEQISALIERSSSNEHLTVRTSDLASDFGVSTRTLQRLFLNHVGVPPKFVLDRYRRQLAAEAARQSTQSWADMAQKIGYADQSHLTKDFSATFGSSPAAYAEIERSNESDS